MAWIFVPIGVGVAVGLMLCGLVLALMVLYVVIRLLLLPLQLWVEGRTPAGRARRDALRQALHALGSTKRGTPEHEAALKLYRSL